MKVLHLISGGDKGGAKTHVFTLLLALQEEIDVTVICVMDGVFYQEIQTMPIPSILMKQKYRNDLTIIKRLVKHIRSEGYNLIHAHGARANFISMFLRPFIKIPIITTVHSDYKLDFTDSLYKKYIYTSLNILALKFSDYYIAVSDNFKKMLISRGFQSNKIYTVYNTIDFDKHVEFESKKTFLDKYEIDFNGKILVGIIGRFDLVKGHEVFINAAYEILKINKNIIFFLAGEGPEENNLRQQAKRLNIEKSIVFTGFLEDIFSLINAIDINVLSSYSESFPYVLLEGALMKKPTVSTAVGGIVDLIHEGETGLLAQPGNYKELAEKILLFINNEGLRQELGNNIYNYAKANFSRESMKRVHIEIYKDILSRQKEDNKIFDIVLSGYYGFDNSGDDALLKAVIDTIRKEKPDIKILVLSKKPKETMEEHNVFSINRYDFLAIFQYIKRARLFVYGGGSLIQDITSTQSLIYYTFLLRLAKYYGLKLMVYANGIGPITKRYNISRAKKALSICDYISLREPQSLEEVKRLGVDVNKVTVKLSVDPVFTIENVNDKSIEDILKNENIDLSKDYFVVSCRTWKYNESNFTDKMANIIDKINKKYNIIPLYIPMHPNDNIILKEIISKSKSSHVILSKIYEVSQLLSIVSFTKFVMSMRLHTLIYGVSTGVPIIGLVYDPKVKFFVEYVKEKTHVDTSNLDIDNLMQMVDYIQSNYTIVKDRIYKESLKLKKLSGDDAKAAVLLLK